MPLNPQQKKAMIHEDKLGAGAAKRRQLPPNQRGSVVMAEFTRGTLYSGSGHKVTNPAQAKAIASSESRGDKPMPAAFEACVKNGGRVRTIGGPSKKFGIQTGQYVRVCFQGGKMVRGEVKTKEKESSK